MVVYIASAQFDIVHVDAFILIRSSCCNHLHTFTRICCICQSHVACIHLDTFIWTHSSGNIRMNSFIWIHCIVVCTMQHLICSSGVFQLLSAPFVASPIPHIVECGGAMDAVLADLGLDDGEQQLMKKPAVVPKAKAKATRKRPAAAECADIIPFKRPASIFPTDNDCDETDEFDVAKIEDTVRDRIKARKFRDLFRELPEPVKIAYKKATLSIVMLYVLECACVLDT